jgi:hypothetical protein
MSLNLPDTGRPQKLRCDTCTFKVGAVSVKVAIQVAVRHCGQCASDGFSITPVKPKFINQEERRHSEEEGTLN